MGLVSEVTEAAGCGMLHNWAFAMHARCGRVAQLAEQLTLNQ